jgi:hypothetical protein
MNRPIRSLLYIFLFGFIGALFMFTSKSSALLTDSITKVSGTASNLSNELLEFVNHEKPTHDHSSIYYKRFYVSKFNLDKQAIEATFSSPMKIQDGDQITVAGYQKDQSFQVLAYNNQTQKVTHHENWIVLGLGAIFFFAIAVWLLNSQLVLEGALIPKLFLLGFTLVGIYMGYRALLIREAIKLISPQ